MALVKVPEWNLTGCNWPGLDRCLPTNQSPWPGAGTETPVPESEELEVEKQAWSLREDSAAYTVTSGSGCSAGKTMLLVKSY